MDVGAKLAAAVALRRPVGYRGVPIRCSESPMPYKANESRRHKIAKARYKVANWAEYDAARRRRTRGGGGRPRDHADIAIESGLMLRAVFRLALRQKRTSRLRRIHKVTVRCFRGGHKPGARRELSVLAEDGNLCGCALSSTKAAVRSKASFCKPGSPNW